MPDLSLILFGDLVARDWESFALPRPAGELLFGAVTFRDRAERIFGARCVAHIGAGHLAGFDEDGAPPVVSYSGAPREGDRLYLSSRAVAAWSVRDAWVLPTHAGPITVGGVAAGWFSP